MGTGKDHDRGWFCSPQLNMYGHSPAGEAGTQGRATSHGRRCLRAPCRAGSVQLRSPLPTPAVPSCACSGACAGQVRRTLYVAPPGSCPSCKCVLANTVHRAHSVTEGLGARHRTCPAGSRPHAGGTLGGSSGAGGLHQTVQSAPATFALHQQSNHPAQV